MIKPRGLAMLGGSAVLFALLGFGLSAPASGTYPPATIPPATTIPTTTTTAAPTTTTTAPSTTTTAPSTTTTAPSTTTTAPSGNPAGKPAPTRATKVTGSFHFLPFHIYGLIIHGINFHGKPKITSNEPGVIVTVKHDHGNSLDINVATSAIVKPGVYTFTINDYGHITKINYVVT